MSYKYFSSYWAPINIFFRMSSLRNVLLVLAIITIAISSNQDPQQLTSVQVHELFHKIVEFQIKLDKKCIRDIIKKEGAFFVIGGSGQGKSTFINFAMGSPLKTVQLKSRGRYVLENDESNPNPALLIGHQRKSKTKQPKILIDDSNRVWVDTPGFKDTEGYKQDILNMLFMNKVLNQVELKKIVLIISQAMLTASRGQFFKHNILKIRSIFGESFGSLIIIVSKATDSVDYRSEMNTIIEDDDSMNAKQNRDFLLKTVSNAKIIPFYAPQYNLQKVEEKQLKHFYSKQRIQALKTMHDVEAVSTKKTKKVFSGDNANKIKNMIEQVQKSVDSEFESLENLMRQITPYLNKNEISSLVSKIDDYLRAQIMEDKQCKTSYLNADIESIQDQIKDVSTVDQDFKLILSQIANVLDRKGQKFISSAIKTISTKIVAYTQVFSSVFQNTYLTMKDGSDQKLVWISTASQVQTFCKNLRSLLEKTLAQLISDQKQAEEMKRRQEQLDRKFKETEQQQKRRFQSTGYKVRSKDTSYQILAVAIAVALLGLLD